MADKLEIYKGALRLLGPSELSTLSDDVPSRYRLDGVWETAPEYLLRQGLWNFAMRYVEIDKDASAPAGNEDPLGAWDYRFTKPDDYLRTAGISNEATFELGFEQFDDRGGFWYANVEKLYVRYVSNHADYGMNLAAWPQDFAKTMEAYMAFESGLPISGDKGNRNDLFSLYKTRLKRAKTLDAFEEAVARYPAGRIVNARFSRRFGKHDG